LFIDLDGLKKINDRYGHNEGDTAIKEASEILKATFRDSDILARLGGDEFTVLIVDAGDETEDKIRERLNYNIDLANKGLNKPYQLSMSAGLIRVPANSSATIEELMEYADMVMYDEKSAKKQSQIQ
jgi:diguanylate cyclase (GGDEF)-like protein